MLSRELNECEDLFVFVWSLPETRTRTRAASSRIFVLVLKIALEVMKTSTKRVSQEGLERLRITWWACKCNSYIPACLSVSLSFTRSTSNSVLRRPINPCREHTSVVTSSRSYGDLTRWYSLVFQIPTFSCCGHRLHRMLRHCNHHPLRRDDQAADVVFHRLLHGMREYVMLPDTFQ